MASSSCDDRPSINDCFFESRIEVDVDSKDILLAQAALRYGFLTEEAIKKCMATQDGLNQAGSEPSLEELFVQYGLLSKTQITEIYQRLGEDVAIAMPKTVRMTPTPSGSINTTPSSSINMTPSSSVKTTIEEKQTPVSLHLPMPSQNQSPSALFKNMQTASTISAPLQSQPERIGRYRIMKLLGQGGMGVVYQAEDELLKRYVAIKILLQTQTPGQIERFKKEAQATAKLNHPNIVALYDIGQLGSNIPGLPFPPETMYLVMEYVAGTSLASIIQERAPLSIIDTLDIILQVTEGLAAAHELHIIHRDIKPANILIAKGNVAKVADFGLAKILADPSLHPTTGLGGITQKGEILGTPYYIAPEQIDADQIDQRADIYSLGITMYQMLTKHFPFPTHNLYGVIFSRLKKDPTPITKYLENIPKSLAKTVHKMIALDPQKRFSSMAEVLTALDEFAVESETPISTKYSTRKMMPPKKVSKLWPMLSIVLLLIIPMLYLNLSRIWIRWTSVIIQDPLYQEVESKLMFYFPYLVKYPEQIGEAKELPVKPAYFKALSKYPGCLGYIQELHQRKEARFIGINDQGYLEYEHIPTQIQFVLLPPGKFQRGSKYDHTEEPPHEVTITKPFLIAKYELSQAIWCNAMEWPLIEPENDPRYLISWIQAMDFCKKFGLDLPTEAEWEYSCRGMTTTKFYWGDTPDLQFLWCRENKTKGMTVASIGQKKPNPFGLYDMAGNLQEWCKDIYAPYELRPQKDPVGPSPKEFGNQRVVRGGNIGDSADRCRSTYRCNYLEECQSGLIGFRPVWR